MTTHKWQFAARFRSRAFGWRSDKPIQRIKEALKEIKQVAKKEPEVAAAGAVLLLEKISPALEQVDSSSGAIGSWVNRAIETLVPIITKAPVPTSTRQLWLERLWQALQDDEMPYIELMGEYWGELCADAELATQWADTFSSGIELVCNTPGFAYYKGTTAYFSSLYAADRHEELLAKLQKPTFSGWWYRQWGVRSLIALDRKAEALRYAESSKQIINSPTMAIDQVCEDILLSSGLIEEAYNRYALSANQGTTHLATFRALVKKYPMKQASDILNDLVAHHPGSEGKWFASAKDAGLFELAIELVNKSPTDPRTLIRASRDYAEKQPDFAVSAGMAALYWMAKGYGYEITSADVLNAYSFVLSAAGNAGMTEAHIKKLIIDKISTVGSGTNFVLKILGDHLSV